MRTCAWPPPHPEGSDVERPCMLYTSGSRGVAVGTVDRRRRCRQRQGSRAGAGRGRRRPGCPKHPGSPPTLRLVAGQSPRPRPVRVLKPAGERYPPSTAGRDGGLPAAVQRRLRVGMPRQGGLGRGGGHDAGRLRRGPSLTSPACSCPKSTLLPRALRRRRLLCLPPPPPSIRPPTHPHMPPHPCPHPQVAGLTVGHGASSGCSHSRWAGCTGNGGENGGRGGGGGRHWVQQPSHTGGPALTPAATSRCLPQWQL